MCAGSSPSETSPGDLRTEEGNHFMQASTVSRGRLRNTSVKIYIGYQMEPERLGPFRICLLRVSNNEANRCHELTPAPIMMSPLLISIVTHEPMGIPLRALANLAARKSALLLCAALPKGGEHVSINLCLRAVRQNGLSGHNLGPTVFV